MHLPVEQPTGQRGRAARIRVGRETGVGDGVDALHQRRVVRHDQPAGRAAQALVGAHGDRVRAFFKRLRPRLAGHHAREVRGIEQQLRAHAVGHLADGRHRVREQVQAAADGDELGLHLARELGQREHVDRVAVGIDRRRHGLQAVEPGRARRMVRHMAADGGRRRDDRVAGLAGRHEHVEVRQRARAHAHLGEARAEHLGRQLGGDDLDALDGFQPHLVLVARVAQRRARTQPARQQRLGGGVHHVGGGVEVQPVDIVDAVAVGHEAFDLGGHARRIARGGVGGNGERVVLAGGGNPGTAVKGCGHAVSR
ncbi:hypothetical protein D9M68_687520 [compost metagenome]